MDSNDLEKYGFKKWYGFRIDREKEILNIIPPDKGVYVIKYKSIFGRFRGKSDIMYIGSSINKNDGLKRRIRFYFKPGPTQETSKRIHALLRKTDGLEIAFAVISNGAEARELEKKLRHKYKVDHGEFPPWNRSA